ncbi:MAG TPA: MFS transporter [Segetibacter sp.]|nr:MFS transporter [Segetibacter sp.]
MENEADWSDVSIFAGFKNNMVLTQERQVSRKKVRLATTVFFFISGFGYSSWASRIPSVQQQLSLSEAQLGAVLLAAPVGLMLTMPFTSVLLGKVNNRKIMFIGAILYNVVLCLPGFTNKTWQLLLVLLAFGSTRNLLNLSANSQAVGVQKLFDRSIMTTFHGIWSLAGFAGAGVGFIMVYLNIATSFHLLTVSIVLIALSAFFYKNTFDQPPVQQSKKPLFLLPDKHLMKFAIICFGCMSCENTMYDWSAIYFHKTVGATQSSANGAFVIYMVCMTIGRFAGDKLVPMLGVKKILNLCGWFIFTGFLFAVILPFPVTAGIGFALVGFGVSCIVPLVFSMAGRSKTMSSGQALAAISTIGYLGFLLVPPVVGFVAQATNLRWSFGLIAVLGAVIIAMVSTIKE